MLTHPGLGPIEIVNCEQGSAEWHYAKLGIPSASDFKKILAGGEGKTRDEYMRKLAAEIISEVPRREYRNADMERGTALEPELRAKYAFETNTDPVPVGFVKRKLRVGWAGYSPDAFIGNDGLLEIKSQAGHLLIATMKAGRIPPEHLPQCQGGMWLTDRAWCDIAIGETGMPLFVRRIHRDDAMIRRLELAVEIFNEELLEMVEWVRRWR
jgi:hypothetical protein